MSAALSLSGVRGVRGVVLFCANGKPVASFPAWMNAHKLPTLDDVASLCGIGKHGQETVTMNGDQLAGLLETVPASGRIVARAESVTVTVTDRKGITHFPITARLLNCADEWEVIAPRGLLTRIVH